MIGKTFGFLTVVAEDPRRNRKRYFQCQCRCGKRRIVYAYDLKRGHSRSCRSCIKIRHGHARKGGHRSPTHYVWTSMLQRCGNPKCPTFTYYGGRGIAVCDRWRLFEHFLSDMGEKPDGLCIERIDNDAGYSPENCKWATRAEQARNRRRQRWVFWNGRNMRLFEAARESGIEYNTLGRRLGVY
jgi:hypothetical protein